MSIKDKKVLLIDDELEILKMVESFLRKDGFSRIYTASNCKEAIISCKNNKPHIVVLDVMLPDGNGFELFTEIRKFSNVPILFVTARGEDQDRLLGLGLGADDYIVKPFLSKELLLRLSSILKRVYEPKRMERLPEIYLDSCIVNLERAIVTNNNVEQSLTAKEYGLLLKLCENKGNIVTSDALCQAVWGDDYYGYENTLMVHIRRLREKIEQNPSKPKCLLTVRGLGYRLIVKE